MQIFYGLPKKSERRPCALAIGNFDGVHLGHQKLLHKVVELAKQRQLVPAVLTFEPHPKEFFGKSPDKAPARILSLRDKVETICRFGIQRIFILRFNEELASLSPKDFAESILAEGLEAKSIVIGENFHFGYKGEGDVHSLTSYGRSLGFDVTPLPMADLGGIPVSSTRIRLALEKGNLDDVAKMLGRPYVITGKVRKGKQLGRTIGFPTINQRILPPCSKARPALRGVYAVKVFGIGKEALPGVACVGRRPTVTDNGEYLLETYIFNFHGDLYGKELTVEFLHKIRDEKKFSSIEQLKSAIHADMEAAEQFFRQH